MNSLVFFANMTAKQVKSLKFAECLQIIYFYKRLGVNVKILCNDKDRWLTSESKKYNIDITKYIYFSEEYSSIYVKNNGWAKYEEQMKRIISKFDEVIILDFIHMGNLREDNVEEFYKTIKRIKEDKFYGTNFSMSVASIRYQSFVNCCLELNVKIKQFVIDTQELNFLLLDKDILRTHYYNCKDKGLVYLPRLGFTLEKLLRNNEKEKECQFNFYCTATTKDRKYVHRLKENFDKYISNGTFNIYCKENKTVLKQDEYYKMLSKTKFSLIIPPYDKKAFSYSRLIECIVNNCVPLVYSKCCLNDIEKTFPQLYKYINKKLIVDENNIQEKLQMNTKYICSDIKEILSNEFKKENIIKIWQEVML